MADHRAPETMSRTYSIAMVAACPFPANYGSPAAIREMSVTLAEMGHRIHMVTYPYGDAGLPLGDVILHRAGEPAAQKSARVGPSADKPHLDFLMLLKLCRVIEQEKIDLIHSHNYEGALIGAAAKIITGKPLVYHAVNLMSDELHTYEFIRPAFVARWLAEVLDAVTPHGADFTIAMTPELERALLRQGVPAERIRVIPCGIQPAMFANADPEPIRERYQLKGRPVVMYTGVNSAFQRIDYLLRAFCAASKSHPEAVLMVVSPLENEPDLPANKALAVELGIADRVIWAGPHSIAELPGYLACADVAVVPRCDCPGHPVKLLNYMMAGRAVACFAGAAKGVTHDRDAWIVPDHDWQELGDGIALLLSDTTRAARLGAEARRTAIEQFDWKSLCRGVEQVYSGLLPAREES